jgi:hypothetical protein
MKLRIIEKNGEYFCQYRCLFIWQSFTEGYANDVIRKTLGEAEDYITDYIRRKTTQSSPKKIVKEYTV